jgi:DNA repair photolyase
MPKYKHSCPVNYEIDLYSGCPFKCSYCIAQSQHELNSTPVYSTSELEKIFIDKNQPEIPFYLSPWTDPYQEMENICKLTRYSLSRLSDLNRKYFVVTRSLTVLRDIEFFENNPDCFIAVSLNCLDQSILNQTEPNSPSAEQRSDLIVDLIQGRVKTVIKIDPVIPGVTDGDPLEKLIKWIIKIKPYAVTTETVRINRKIAKNINSHLSSSQFKKLISFYPPIDHQPRHPQLEYRLKLFKWMEKLFTRHNIPISFCRASFPLKLTDYDCRGGFSD